ncbi:MAG: prepilin-type N-terminal cleavage/methylation domain-containing protein [Armatimonadota bacterium]|nr:prepilin-type N-terminal cleavage/methylation domain-containing protein [Armatimonadota bacterium]MDR5703745.1 prepilin-type N-terminal cleavage/methylation domain-containing protein [Armatimonadota bacterium]
MKDKRRRRKGEQGFTLIELIVVVSIILILAALIAPNLVDIEDRARRNAVIADAKALKIAFDLYFLNDTPPKNYPPTTEIPNYTGLRNTLSPYVTLPPAETDANFTFSSYNATTSPPNYQLVIVGKDSAPTTVTITKNSISY